MQGIKKKELAAVAFLGFLFLAKPATAQQTLPPVYSDTAKQNYVRTWDATSPQSDPDTLITRSLKDVKQATQYLDGLGRPLQTVIKKGSLVTGSNPVDLVTANVYDEFSREANKYLPFAANSTGGNTSINDGLFKLNPFQQDSSFNKGLFSDESWYYGQTNFESSPLNRVLENFAPGNSWAGTSGQSLESDRHSTKIKYWINTVTDSVRAWKVTDVANSFGHYDTLGYYAAGQLFKNVTVDEHGNQVIEFKDKKGLVILKKLQLTAVADTGTGKGHYGWLCTYYIYDDLNNLRCVIQPEGVKYLSQNSWVFDYSPSGMGAEQCFRYEYDGRNRMIMKKVPGAGTVWMVYDTRDRLVMTQDSIMRSNHQWLLTQYDSLNRSFATGLLTDNTNYNNLSYHSTRADTSLVYPTSDTYTVDTLTKTFYDDYTWRAGQGNPLSATRSTSYDSYLQTASNTAWPYPQDATTQTNHLRGLVTGTKIKVLGTSSTYLYAASFYDYKGRVIQSQSQNITTGTDISTTQYGWAGQPVLTIVKNEKAVTGAQASIILTQMTYDSLNRVTKIEKKASNTKVNSGAMPGTWKTIVQNEYDALGQLKKKKLGAAPLDSLNYEYNIRGWMLGMNRAYVKDTASTINWFGFDLGYDKTSFTVNGNSKNYTAAEYNGNIEGMLWKSSGDGKLRKYDFTYDAVNRLTGADFNQLTNNSFSTNAGINFSVFGLNYDANGNILHMNQKGWKVGGSETIDSLTYSYISNSNKLQGVYDYKNDTLTKLGDFRSSGLCIRGGKNTSSTDYSYDANGNMYVDNNKDISNIHYNHLNLPDSITVTGKGNIKYVYDATGNKLKKITTEGAKVTTTLYLFGNYVNDTLQFLPQEEGRIRYNVADSSLQYDYFVKDHLGNVRMLLTEQKDTSFYPPASMETAQATTEEALYSNVSETRTTPPSGYPTDTYTNPNDYVAGLDAGDNKKIGPGIVLRVMAGDKFNIRVSSWWHSTDPPGDPGDPSDELLTAMSNSVGAVTGSHGGLGSAQLISSGVLPGVITSFLSSQSYDDSKPAAYINWLLLDDQFNMVAASSGFEQVGVSDDLTIHTLNDLPITQNGYLYIYTSNATKPIEVFFDNLQVTHIRGPLVSEDHYYPFGERMYGICSEALNFGDPESQKKKYNGIEKENDLSIEVYDAQLRDLDGQIGRWWQIDPKIENMEMWSPYASNYDNAMRYSDPLGDEAGDCCGDFIDGLIDGTRKVLISASGILNGGLNTMSFGLISSDPFGMRNKLSGDELELYNNSVTLGKIGPVVMTDLPSEKPPTLELVPVANSPKSLPVTVKSPVPVVPITINNSTTQTGRGKNNRKPDPNATGDHSVINKNGSTTFKKNDKNPTGWDEVERIDVKGKPHKNKDGTIVPTPHKHTKGKSDVIPLDPAKDNMPRML